MTPTEWAKLAAVITGAYPSQPLPTATLELWFTGFDGHPGLERFEFRDVQAAVWAHAVGCTRRPELADLYQGALERQQERREHQAALPWRGEGRGVPAPAEFRELRERIGRMPEDAK
jgi:hypothetical protein